MVRLQSGDERAFDELMARYKLPVVNFIYRMLHDADEANDVAQEVFVRVYRHRDRFRADGKHRFSTWLFQIARNLTIDAIRRRKRRPLEFLDPAEIGAATAVSMDPASDREAANREVRDLIVEAISILPEKQRTALILSEYHDLSHAEIAAILKCTAKSVESRLARARTFLRDKLGHLMRS